MAAPETVTKGGTVEIIAVVTDGLSPVEGAVVTVDMNFPSGLIISKIAVTDASGEAVVSYKINTKRTGTGDVNVTVTATKVGYEDGSETWERLFEVQ